MQNESLISERIVPNSDSKHLVIFGGNIYRRDEIVRLLAPIANLSIHATLSEEQGIAKIKELNKVDIVLIGGRYTLAQRASIKAFLKENYPSVIVTEPGVDYEYSNELIYTNIKKAI
jgi:hypothetical protein